MIISHRFQTVFLHIPKNAGTAIRNVVKAGDPESDHSWGYRFLPRLYRFGDSAHLPLVDLPPDKLSYVNQYTCFAVLRDPLERFVSATSQHFSQHKYRTPRTPAQLLGEIDSIRIRYDPAYIHFCPQHFYTHINERQVVSHLFQMNDPELDSKVLDFLRGRGFAPKTSGIRPLNLTQGAKPELGDDFDMARFYQLYKRDYDLFGFTPPIEPLNFEINADAQSGLDQPIDFSSYDQVHFLDHDFTRNK